MKKLDISCVFMIINLKACLRQLFTLFLGKDVSSVNAMSIFYRVILFALLSGSAVAANVKIEGFRSWDSPDKTRVVFELNTGYQPKVWLEPNPPRLVIDFKDTRVASSNIKFAPNHLVKNIRSATNSEGTLRIVFDLKEKLPYKTLLLKPYQMHGHRYIIDLFRTKADIKEKSRAPTLAYRNIVIAVDAGHGGEDPGAEGPGGVIEKHVVLKVAQRLAKLIQAEPGFTAVMTRKGDYFVNLDKRRELARKANADLFVSLHADAFHNPKVKGSSVFTLSESASSKMAEFLAEKENRSDLIGGTDRVPLHNKGDDLIKVLIELSQTGTKEVSTKMADQVLRELKTVGHVHSNRVQRAGFVVLKSPDVPSILVETAFISNPQEAKNLASPTHQKKLAKAMFAGIKRHFLQNAPPGTRIANLRQHQVRNGETLSGIAQKYRISLNSLRLANALTKKDYLRIGAILNIPVMQNI